MPLASKPVRIDLSQFKLHIRITPRTDLTLHFDSPSRRFYLSLIALVIRQMRELGRVTSIPLDGVRDHLLLLNDTVGGGAGSAQGLIPRIYRKWKNALPDLENAPLFKVMGKRKEEGDGGRVYRFSDDEKDAWANLFEYKGSEENVRLRFSLDRIDVGLDDVTIMYEGSLDSTAWERFIADLRKTRTTDPQNQEPHPPVVVPPSEGLLYQRVFVGRQSELRQLQSSFDRAISGRGSLVMVVGEPGIGKTALWEQLSQHVTERGGMTLVGHSYEEGSLSLPYLPFVEALGAYVRTCPSETLQTQLGAGAFDVARILPELRDTLGTELSERKGGGEDRYRLFQGVTDFLGVIAQSRALLLVLEDLHNADGGTLELLCHVSRFLLDKRFLVIGTYRDIQVDRTHPLSSALAELKRLSSYSRLLLRGLDLDEVGQMCRTMADHEIPRPVAEAVYRQTEGNPLFVQEVIRYLVESGAADGHDAELRIPDGLKDVVGKRLSGLSETCNKLLGQASVIGRDFRLDLLEEITDLPEDVEFSALEEARKAAIIEEHAALGGAVTYRFTHAFFRQTLYEEIIAPRRIRLHHQVARALERIHGARLEEHAAALADHYAHSSDVAELAKAVHYGEVAATRASSVYAYSEAARLLEQALKVQEIVDPEDRGGKCDLLLELGDALNLADEPRKSLDGVASQAFSLAEGIEDGVRMSRACWCAALCLTKLGSLSMQGWGTPEAAQWVERADKHALPDTVHRVMADIAKGNLSCIRGMYTGDTSAAALGVRSLFEARDLALRLDDPWACEFAAMFWLAYVKAPQHFWERLEFAESLTTTTFVTSAIRGVVASLTMLVDVFLSSGMRERAEEYCKEARVVASRTGLFYNLQASLVADSFLATLDGRLDEAVQLSDRVRDLATEAGLAEFGATQAGMCGVTPRLYLGKYEEAYVAAVAHKVGLIAYVGKTAEAREILDRWVVARPGIGTDEDETGANLDTALLAAAVLVGHTKAAELLLSRLSVAAAYGIFTNRQTCIGRHLGAAAVFLGRPDESRRYYDQAMVLATKLRFRPEIALIRLQQAELILGHYPDESATAREYLDFAIAEFREMKMTPSLERALSLANRLSAPHEAGGSGSNG